MATAGFNVMKPGFPPRLWALYGESDAGKTTFAAQMRGPILAIDADGRFKEVLRLSETTVYELSPNKEDNVNPDKIAEIITQKIAGSNVQTIAVDSLTAIIAPLVMGAYRNTDGNRSAKYSDKATAMRLLQDVVTGTGRDVLWIWHVYQSTFVQKGDRDPKPVNRESLSLTEAARLHRSINMRLKMFREGDRRGITVEWAKHGRSGITLWDEPYGYWYEMPERIEQAVYGGLTPEDMANFASLIPEVFTNPAHAIAWGWEMGAFNALPHSRQAYLKLRETKQPKNAAQMREIWVEDVKRRLSEQQAENTKEQAQNGEK